tara:strand:+ start:1244 stop:1579 length:336 start_codon:yes stop_codon:yes gene_type:complete
MANRFKKYDDQKKVVFYEKEDRHAKLLIRLHYDSLKQGEFFRALINGYVEGDEDIFRFVQNYKLANTKSKRQVSIAEREKKKTRQLAKIFSLSDDEREELFDILEEERGDL